MLVNFIIKISEKKQPIVRLAAFCFLCFTINFISDSLISSLSSKRWLPPLHSTESHPRQNIEFCTFLYIFALGLHESQLQF